MNTHLKVMLIAVVAFSLSAEAQDACTAIPQDAANIAAANSVAKKARKPFRIGKKTAKRLKPCDPKQSKKAGKKVQRRFDALQTLINSVTTDAQQCETSSCTTFSGSFVTKKIKGAVRKLGGATKAARRAASSCTSDLVDEERINKLVKRATKKFKLEADVVICTLPDEDSPIKPPKGTPAAGTDTDGDGITDRVEQLIGSDPTDANSPAADGAADSDGDGLTNAQDVLNGQLVGNADSDGDGVPDALDIRTVGTSELAANPFGGLAPAGSAVTVTAVNSAGMTATATTTAAADGTWNLTLDLSSFEDGKVRLRTSIGDRGSYFSSFTIDTVAPAAPAVLVTSTHELPVVDPALLAQHGTADRLNSGIRTATVPRASGGFFRLSSSGPDAVTERRNATDSSQDIFLYSLDANGDALDDGVIASQTTLGKQNRGSLITLTDGSLFAVWVDHTGLDGSSTAIMGRRFDTTGAPTTDEFVVNQVTLGTQNFPAPFALANGGYGVAFQHGASNFDQQIRFVLFDSSNTLQGMEVLVSTTATVSQVPLARELSNGNLVIAYRREVDVDVQETFARVYQPDASPLTDEFLVQSTPTNEFPKSITDLSNGGFILCMGDSGADSARLSSNPLVGNVGATCKIYSSDATEVGVFIPHAFSFARQAISSGMDTYAQQVSDGFELFIDYPIVQLGDRQGTYRRVFDNNGAPQPVTEAVSNGLYYFDSDEATPFTLSGTAVGATAIVASLSGTSGISQLSTTPDADGNWELAVPGSTLAGLGAGEGTVTVASVDSASNTSSPVSQSIVSYATSNPPQESARIVNQVTRGRQRITSLEKLADGRSVIAWDDFSADPADMVFARVLDANGTPQGNDIPLSTDLVSRQVGTDLAPLANGGFVATWFANVAPGDNDIYARIYNSSLQPVGPEFVVNTTTTANQLRPKVAVLPLDEFVIMWTGQGPGDNDGVFIQRFDVNGVPVGVETRVNETTTGNQQLGQIASLAGGGFAVVWDSAESPRTIKARLYNTNNVPATGEFSLATRDLTENQTAPIVVGTPGGDYLFAWGANTPGADGQALRARIYSSAGAPQSVEETEITLDMESRERTHWVIPLADGGFQFFYALNVKEFPRGHDIAFQRTNSSLAPVGEEKVLNVMVNGNQQEPFAVPTANDGAVVGFSSTDFGQDVDVVTLTMDANGEVLIPEYTVE